MPPQLFGPAPQRSLFDQPAEATPAPVEDSGPGLGTAALLGGGALAAGLIARNPKAAWEGAKTVGRGLGAARQQLMLSGLALPKSVLGNVGATAVMAGERGTMAPLKELFSMDTARDALRAYRTNAPMPGALAGSTLPGPVPSRFMGALDEATRNAMQRSGATAQEAEKAVFQAPLPGALGKALDNPVMRYLIPFRRTPFNQLIEGAGAFSPENAREAAMLAGSLGAGATHGAATAEDRFPMSVGVAAAGAAKYGLPYSVGALAGRKLAGGQGGGGLASAAVPVGEYGIESGIANPLQPFFEPAGVRALKKIFGE